MRLSMKMGTITVNLGSMFSGKTEELLRQMRRAKYAQRSWRLFKPAKDNRHAGVEVVTHEGNSMEAIVVERSRDILDHVTPGMTVGIDEGQFFDDELIIVCRQLKKAGCKVHISGLDMKFNGTAFMNMAELAMIANKVNKFHAVCVQCGEDAYVSHRLVQSDEDILVGGADEYEALCESCDLERKMINSGTH